MLILRTEIHFNNLSITLSECSLPLKLYLQLCQESTAAHCRLRRITAAPVPSLPHVLHQAIPFRCPSTSQLGAEGASDPFPSSYKTECKGAEVPEAALPPSCQMCSKPLNRPGKLSPSGKLTPREDSEGLSCWVMSGDSAATRSCEEASRPVSTVYTWQLNTSAPWPPAGTWLMQAGRQTLVGITFFLEPISHTCQLLYFLLSIFTVMLKS